MLLWVCSLISLSFGSYESFSANESSHLLSLGGGISGPSQNSALFENPAGLVFNHQTQGLFSFSGQNSSFKPKEAGAQLLLGNGTVGSSLAFEYSPDEKRTRAHLGIGTYLVRTDWVAGVSVQYESMTPSEDWNMNLGVLYQPEGEFRIGATLFGLASGVDAIALGFTSTLSPWTTFSLDASSSPKGQGKVIKPSFGVNLPEFQLVYGYGIHLDEDIPSQIRAGNSVALGFNLAYQIHFQAYYNQLNLYYFAVTIGL